MIVTIGLEDRQPPPEAQRELQEAFGAEFFYEWMPRSKRWAVKRRVPWDRVSQLAREGKITEADIEAHMEARYAQGFEDAGEALIIHAFTVQDKETGEPIEPCSAVVEAMRAADSFNRRGKTVREMLREVISRNKEREEKIRAKLADEIEQAVDQYEPWLRGLPRMFYPNQEKTNE